MDPVKVEQCMVLVDNFFRVSKEFRMREQSLPRDTQTTPTMSNYSPPRNCKFRRGQKTKNHKKGLNDHAQSMILRTRHIHKMGSSICR